MADDPLNTAPPGAPPAPSGQRFKCVFCHCVMTGDGESVWSMGDLAKDYEIADKRHAEAIAAKDDEIATLRAELKTARDERDALKSSGGVEKSAYRPGGRIQA